MPDGPTRTPSARTGRPPRTSAARLQEVALKLFVENGFDTTTIDDVAEAAGIGRRTFFRYHASKNDLVWGDFDAGLEQFRAGLADGAGLPMAQALTEAVVAFNAVPRRQETSHRQRMFLILTVPALQAHATLRYAAWRHVVEEFAVERTGEPPGSLVPRLVGHTALAASLSAYEQWLVAPGARLEELLRRAFGDLGRMLAAYEAAPGTVRLTGRASRGRRGSASR